MVATFFARAEIPFGSSPTIKRWNVLRLTTTPGPIRTALM
jgi:hypothetical protein